MSDRSKRDQKLEAASRYEFAKSTRRSFISRLGMAACWPRRLVLRRPSANLP